MGSITYGFLNDSFLFKESYINAEFASFTDDQLLAELERYRNFVLDKTEVLDGELGNGSSLAGYFRTSEMSIRRLCQTAMYLDNVLLDDPIFKLTAPRSNMMEPYSQLLGVAPAKRLDRKALAEAATYMRACIPFVADDYVKFGPLSRYFEAPKEMPFTVPIFQKEIIESELFQRLYKDVKVFSVKRTGQELQLLPLEVSRGLSVILPLKEAQLMFFLNQTKFKAKDEKEGIYEVRMELPDTLPTQREFDVWLEQSKTKTVLAAMSAITFDYSVSSSFGRSVITSNPYIYDLIKQPLPSVEEDTFNEFINLDLPYIDLTDPTVVMQARDAGDTVFNNFRHELEKSFRDIASIKDESQREIMRRNIIHELTKVQVAKVETKMKSIKSQQKIDAVIFAASLAAAKFTGGLSLAANLIMPMAKEASNRLGQREKLTDLPGLFYWKLKEASKNK